MKELETALENERTEIEGGGGGAQNQDILEAVKNMKAIKINTVTNVVTDDNRWLVEHQIPGRAGVDSEVSASVIQDLEFFLINYQNITFLNLTKVHN